MASFDIFRAEVNIRVSLVHGDFFECLEARSVTVFIYVIKFCIFFFNKGVLQIFFACSGDFNVSNSSGVHNYDYLVSLVKRHHY